MSKKKKLGIEVLDDDKKCQCGSPKKREQKFCDDCHKVRSSGEDYPKYLLKKSSQ